ncbi:MAG: hypothetical protein ACTSWX_05050 [Promethearchaeota archaeon]
MITFQELYGYIKEHNILSGILIFNILSVILFPLTPFMLFVPGDIDIIFGAIIGILWGILYREKPQKIWKIVFLVGILGCLLSTLGITAIAIILSKPTPNFKVSLLIFSFNLLIYELLSIIIGVMIGIIAYYKQDNKKFDLRKPKL